MTTNPDAMDRWISPAENEAMFARNVEGRLRPLDRRLVHASTCLYTVSPDSGFVFDRHTDHDNVWVVSACSSHAFKHSAGLGEAIASRVRGDAALDLSAE